MKNFHKVHTDKERERERRTNNDTERGSQQKRNRVKMSRDAERTSDTMLKKLSLSQQSLCLLERKMEQSSDKNFIFSAAQIKASRV